MSIKRWKFKHVDSQIADQLQAQLKINPVLCRLLSSRNINTFEEARDFFRPQLEHLHDPFLMDGMQKAVDRINEAMARGEKILFYGDYDVDGTTAVSLMSLFFKNIYPHFLFYIPDRYSEGYGISYIGLDWAHHNPTQ